MQIPNFLKLEGDALVYNGKEGTELVYYVPDSFFNNTAKTAIAEIVGQYVSMIGVCSWTIVEKNGKLGEFKPLKFPTMMLCKPYNITKEKDVTIGTADPDDYRILHFKVGDEVLSQTRVPQLTENIELFFKMMFYTAKIPNTISQDDLLDLLVENAALNDFNYGINYQLIGMIIASLCRDPKDINKASRLTNNKDPHYYKMISMKLYPKLISPYSAITSENWDEGIRASIMLSDKPDNEIPFSPLEKVMTQ